MKERETVNTRDKENKCKGETDFNKDVQTGCDPSYYCVLTLEIEKNVIISAKSVMFYVSVVVLQTGFLMNNSPVHSCCVCLTSCYYFFIILT